MSEHKNIGQLCMMLYGLYTASLLSFCTDSNVATLGVVAGAVGVILAYARRKAAKHTPYESHMQYLIRTFWLGGGVWTPVATILAAALIYFFSDMTAVHAAMASGPLDILAISDILHQYLMQNKTLLYAVLGSTFGPVALWWLWRCGYGYRLAKAGKPVPNPNGWF